jgi:hypothetical protein
VECVFGSWRGVFQIKGWAETDGIVVFASDKTSGGQPQHSEAQQLGR